MRAQAEAISDISPTCEASDDADSRPKLTKLCRIFASSYRDARASFQALW